MARDSERLRETQGTAFLVQSSTTFDFSPLIYYASKTVSIFNSSVFPDNSTETVPRNSRRALEVLSTFNAASDFLVPSGDPVNISIVTSILTALLMADGKTGYRMLKWDRLQGGYYAVTVKFIAPF